MAGMGVKIDQFEIPVCNSFQERIFRDQLCYQVDLNRFHEKNNIVKELRLGFTFLLDYNEDRQITFDQDIEVKTGDFFKNIIHSDDNQQAHIYLDIIGKYKCTGLRSRYRSISA